MNLILLRQKQNFILLQSSLGFVLLFIFSGCAISNPFVPLDGYSNYPSTVCTIPDKPISSNIMYRATMRPYKVGGVTYCPTTVATGEQFKGIASWYGPNFHGGQTSNGEYYDMYAHTAAHKTLPINTRVRVTNLKNGKSTIVRINDRGPFVKNRIIDLSYGAAQDINLIKYGTAPVKLEILSFDQKANKYAHKQQKKPLYLSKKLDDTPLTPNLIQMGKLYIQVASFTNQQKALAFKRKCYNKDARHQTAIKKKKIATKTIYSVLIGDFYSIAEAKDYINRYTYNGAFIVRD